MKKAELLTQIENDSLGIVKTEVVEQGTLENGKTYHKYNANVYVEQGGSSNFVNIPFTVLNEGETDEDARITQQKEVPKKSVARAAVEDYLDGLSPATYIRYTITEVNEDDRSAKVSAVKDNGDGTGTEVRLFVYKNGGKPVEHVELTA